MKKIGLIAALVICALTVNAQEYWFQEGFATSTPTGWIRTASSTTSLSHDTYTGTYAVKFGLPGSGSTDPDTGLLKVLVTPTVQGAGTLKFWLTKNASTVNCNLHVGVISNSDTTWQSPVLISAIPQKPSWQEYTYNIDNPNALRIIFFAREVAGMITGAFMAFDDISLTKYSGVSTGCQSCTSITKFEVPGQIGASIIDTLAGTINVTVPSGTNIKLLTPTIETEGEKVELLWNKGDDACPHLYSSIARDGSSKEYQVQYIFQAVTLPEYHFREGFDATLGITTPGMVNTLGGSTSQNHGLYATGSKCFAATTTYYNGAITTPVVNSAGVFKFWVMGSSASTGISFKVEKIVNGVTTLLADYPQPHGKTWTEYTVVVNDVSTAIQLKLTTYDCTIATLYIDDLSLTSFAGSNKPSITSIKTSPQYPEGEKPFAITANITDSDDYVASAKVMYGSTSDKLIKVSDMTLTSGSTYKSANIQAAEGDTIFYKIIAFDNFYVSDTSELKQVVVLHGYSHVEEFTASSLGATAGSGSFTNGNITWNYTAAKAATMDSKAIALEANGTLYATIASGVSLLRFDYLSMANANLEIQVNNSAVAQVNSGAEATSPDMRINAPVGTTLKIVNKSASSVSLDNIRWDDFEAVTITEKPLTMQLYPALPDSGTVRFAGVANSNLITNLTLSAYKNNTLYKSVSAPLTYTNNAADFDLAIRIPAELTNFEFRYKTNLMAKEDTLARNVVAGDVYIISGQSNGAAGTSVPKDSISDFFRAYGRMYKPGATEGDVYDPELATWGKANSKGASYSADYFNGYSGYVLSKNILQKQKRPSLILNVSVGGTSIAENLRNDNDHYDQNTIYGRGLYRAKKAGIQQYAKAIIWVQGEGNQNNTYTTYGENFAKLRSAWKSDYAGVQKIYVSQINLGCSGYTALGSELREAQRKLQDAHNDVEVMSNVGVPIRYDSCHYTPEGYDMLYGRYYDLLARDFYNVQKDLINPPNVQKVFFANQSSDTIAIKFNQEIELPAPMYGRQMKDYFYNENKQAISTSQLIKYNNDSTIILLISSANISATKLTYGPDAYVAASSRDLDTLYVGPWLKNIRGISALTFDKFIIGREALSPTSVDPDTTPKSSQCIIRSFKIGITNGVIKNDTIWVKNLPANTDLSALQPTILISDKATISPLADIAQNFSIVVTYTVTAEDGVTQKSYKVVVSKQTSTGASKELDEQLLVYPNPVGDVLHINFPLPIVKVEIYHMDGVLVRQSHEHSINVRTLHTGSYIVKVYTANGVTLTRKITISR